MQLMGMSKTTSRLNHVSAAHIVASWIFVEMALSIWIAVQYKNRVVCPMDVTQHANTVYKHLADWVRGEARTVPTEVKAVTTAVMTVGVRHVIRHITSHRHNVI